MEKLSPVAKELKEEFSKLLMEGVFQFELKLREEHFINI